METSAALVLESPDVAFQARPQIFDLPTQPTASPSDNLPNITRWIWRRRRRNLIFVHGRDRNFSLDAADKPKSKAQNSRAAIFDFDIKALHRQFRSDDARRETRDASINPKSEIRNPQLTDLALLGAEGAIIFKPKRETIGKSRRGSLPTNLRAEMSTLIPARVSGQSADELLAP